MTRPARAGNSRWRRPAGRYAALLALPPLVLAVLMAITAGVLASGSAGSPPAPSVWLVAGGAAMLLPAAVLRGLRARAMGYRLRDDDLLVRQGLMHRQEVAAPYGRMQHIDVQQPALSRVLGLAEVRLSTAAQRTIRLPGLPHDEARALRDQLAGLAASRRAGL